MRVNQDGFKPKILGNLNRCYKNPKDDKSDSSFYTRIFFAQYRDTGFNIEYQSQD